MASSGLGQWEEALHILIFFQGPVLKDLLKVVSVSTLESCINFIHFNTWFISSIFCQMQVAYQYFWKMAPWFSSFGSLLNIMCLFFGGVRVLLMLQPWKEVCDASSVRESYCMSFYPSWKWTFIGAFSGVTSLKMLLCSSSSLVWLQSLHG